MEKIYQNDIRSKRDIQKSLVFDMSKTSKGPHFFVFQKRIKIRASKLHQFSSKIAFKKYTETTSTAITLKEKQHRNDVDFSPIEIVLNKVHRNDVDFLLIEITSKKYIE